MNQISIFIKKVLDEMKEEVPNNTTVLNVTNLHDQTTPIQV